MNVRVRTWPWAVLSLTLACATQQATAPQPSAAPAPASTVTPRPPEFRLGTEVRPRGYTVELTADPERERFDGVVEVALELSQPTRQLWLHGNGLKVKEATLRAGERSQPARAVTKGDQFLGFLLEEPVGPGEATLRVVYEGRASEKETTGFFRQRDGERWYAMTHFQPDDARRAVPCFDEPGFKVPWQLTLRVRPELAAFANTPVESEEVGADGLKTVRFRPTPPLPSYLLAFAVGPFETVDAGPAGSKGAPVRIVVPHGRTAEAAWAARATPPLVERLEEYFGLPYPYEKLDVLAVPQPALFGAMENPGLITFQMPLLLARPEQDSLERQRQFTLVQAHELAHQWFGNLVTLSWWDDTWLNESFATWLALKVTDAWKPEWNVDAERVHTRGRALMADRLTTARSIRQPVNNESDLLTAFDGGITYAKGSAVLAMFESSVGPERFREGVRAYMRRHAQGNTTAADFFRALSEAAGTDMTPALSTFLDQPGIPLVSMQLRCAAGAPPKLMLAQRRYLPVGAPSVRAQTWQVPVCVRHGTGGHEGRACTTLTEETGALVLEDAKGCPDWLVPNAGARGYYHAKLEGELLRRLTRDGGKRLTLAEQMGLLGEARALVASGDLPVEEALTLVTRLLPSEDKDLLTGALQVVGSVRPEFIPDAMKPRYASFVRRTFGDKARALGFHPRPGEEEATRLLRPTLVKHVALEGQDEKLRSEARGLALRWLEDRRAVSPEMVNVVLQVAARQGDASLHQRLLKTARETKEPTERRQLLRALGSFQEPVLVRASLSLLLSEDFTIFDSLQGIGFRMMSEPSTREPLYAYVKENLDAILARLPHEAGGIMIHTGSGFCDAEHRQDVEAFFKERAPKYPGGEIHLARVLEGVDLCIAQRELVQPSVTRFLSRN